MSYKINNVYYLTYVLSLIHISFTGYFLSGVIQNLEVSEILTIASAASALAVSVDGAANSIPEETDVKQFLTQYQ